MTQMKWKAVTKEQAEAAHQLGFNVEMRFFAELPADVRIRRNASPTLPGAKGPGRGGSRAGQFKLALTTKKYEWHRPGTVTEQVYTLVRDEAFNSELKAELTREDIIKRISKRLPKDITKARVRPLLSDLVKRGLLRRVPIIK